MADIIQLLPEHVANQIAAGEVVQRAASVVKELLENAIDSGATDVQIIIKDAGKSLIQIIDNGTGMSPTDARMAFERHATSKISETKDIFNILTKGFRGEALASIAAIAQVELKSKTEQQTIGTEIFIEGGKIKSQESGICKKGTTISVKNLFYNVPARRNFLKSDSVEFRHILDEFHRIAVPHYNVAFSLQHNGEEVFRLMKTHLAQRLLHIFGRRFEGNLVAVEEKTELVQMNGFVGKPDVAKKSRGEQFFFVNNRFIRSGYLHKAIIDAFESLIPKAYHPAYFLFLNIDPSRIDINIHPTKTEIKFEDEYAIYAMLRSAVKHALGQYQVAPTLMFDRPEWEIPILQKTDSIHSPTISVSPDYNPFSSSNNAKPKLNYFELEDLPVQPTVPGTEVLQRASKKSVFECFQWGSSYIVTEKEDVLLLIDQHRAHQKVLFEGFIQKQNKNTLSQQLLFPIHYDVATKEYELLQDAETYLISYGFDFQFNRSELIVNAIPGDLSQTAAEKALKDFLENHNLDSPENVQEELAKFMAKSAAIKKGEKLEVSECIDLVEALFKTGAPAYSPFGKKIYKAISKEEIAKFLD